MNSTSVNLLLAVLLLAANAFYVAAEFALVKSRGFRVKAMVEQNRFGARLLQSMMGNIEAYLACCQLGITMASLGLGWVGEPTVSALLGRFSSRSDCRNPCCTSRRFWLVSWCSPRCIS
jgi:CBS domain containing-hemolysin-like protein